MPSHYDEPELYARALDPDDAEWAWLDRWIDLARGGGRPPAAVLDPACGPGGYLLRWARAGADVYGIDRSPAMAAFARTRLAAAGGGSVAVGDMRAPALPDDSCDLVLNLNASVGHLPSDEAVAEHLAAMRRVLRPRGAFLLGATVLDDESAGDGRRHLWRSPWLTLSDGSRARLGYVSVRRDRGARSETIEVTVERQSSGAVPKPSLQSVHSDPRDPVDATMRAVECYDLHTHTGAGLAQLVADAGFELVAWVDPADGGEWPVNVGLAGDVIAVLRPR